MKRFENRIVMITGASGGIGSVVAERFAAEGARLVLSGTDVETLQALADSLDTEVACLDGDIRDPQTAKRLCETALNRFGGLDIAINNAGIAHSFVRLQNIPDDEAEAVVATNLMGIFYCLRHQIPLLSKGVKADGEARAIVNIASVAGLRGIPRLALYTAAKHGVVGLTKAVAAENAEKKIRINAVCPGFTRTPMLNSYVAMAGATCPNDMPLLAGKLPMKRVAEVEEVVAAILFAADPANGFMTGQAIAIDGGLTAV
ncbi:SDR family NAD(P)-dependent oxidoreductase [Limoniibacter endophyticus]|nr:SDR family NAD(P)-dependent oxidoreductase [Limoniibacter endophyticus]